LQHTYIKVLRDNLRAVAFNRNLGYKILPDQENEFNQRYMLNSRNYFLVAERFRHSFVKLHGAIFTLTLDHPNDEAEKNIREIYLAQPLENKKRLNLIVA